MEAISLTINGKRVSCPSGTRLLTVAEANGFKIPTLCHHPDLKPFGSCRMCLVEDEKSGRIMASCVTPAAPDMAVLTDSPRVLSHRKNIIRLMMAEHPESCLVCSKGNRCRLREIAAEMGLGETGLYPMANFKPVETLNPFIVRDLSKCILCGKCIRADHELVVAGAIDYHGRGFQSRPATVLERPLEHSTCTFCGTCVSICPTGALSTASSGYVGSPEREALTPCSFCGVGCLLRAGAAGERVVEVNPSGVQGSVNGATLCVRGHFAHDYLNAPGRLTTPMIRKENELSPVSWEEALGTVTERLLEIKKAHGPQSIGFLGSSKCTNEENYLFQKMARTLIGCNNVDNAGTLDGRPALSVIDERTGWGCRVNPLARLEQAEAILMMGADPGQSTPVLGYHVRRAVKKGIPLVGVDVRKTDLTPFAAAWACIRPGKDLEWIYCLTARLWKRFGHDATYIEQFTEGFGPYCDAVSAFNPERLCMETGVDMAALDRAADLLKGRKISVIIGDGITRQPQGPVFVDAVLNLALMTGSLGHDRAGLYVVTRENNQAGAWDMGAVPDALPGRAPVSDATGRHEWERAWKAKLSPDGGLSMIRMVEAAEKGTLKALYVMGENPVLSLPQHERVAAALERLDLLVVQDILDTDTSRLADVRLPGAAAAEKGGSFTNMEGRITRFDPVVAPPGDSRADWAILDRLSEALGAPRPFRSVERIQEEIARLIHPYAALNRMPDEGWAWLRHAEPARLFSGREDGPLIPFSALADMKGDDGDETYPFSAVLGNLRFHLGSGTRSGRSRRIDAFAIHGEASISPEDGRALSVAAGDTVHIQSPHGSITRAVRIDRDLPEGCVFIPTGVHGNDALNLVGLVDVNDPGFEGFTRCRVQLKAQGGADEAQGD